MTDQGYEREQLEARHTKPYGPKHHIPTIQGYREHRKELVEQYGSAEEADENDESRTSRAYNSAKDILTGDDDQSQQSNQQNRVYPAANHNRPDRPHQEDVETNSPANIQAGEEHGQAGQDEDGHHEKGQGLKSPTEVSASAVNAKEKRKAMKHSKGGGGRRVTDPVTHLPITIRDQTDKDLNSLAENLPVPGSLSKTATGLEGASKNQEQLDGEADELQRSYDGMQKTFPPPKFKRMEKELASLYQLALVFGLGGVGMIAALAVFVTRLFQSGASWGRLTFATFTTAGLILGAVGVIFAVQGWLANKVKGVWEDETWEAHRSEEERYLHADSELPESVQWLNSLLANVWPLINPDLFAALIDTLEDVMQASLPKVVRMVSVDDAGQGSESIRVLGIRWLPTGAAGQSVDDDGKLRQPDKGSTSDRTNPGAGQEDKSAESGQPHGQQTDKTRTEQQNKQEEQEQEAMRAGMEAEEGDFINLELALAYRARSSGKTLASKARNPHLYLKFYFPGQIAIPVWVEMRGFIGIVRLRLQLTPDPPFFSLCTMTFLGQPKADLSCVPLSKHSLNVMDVPLISGFVQSAIGAALSEYVAPKSLTLNLKDMMMGEDFKKDTICRGVVWIYIKQARGFKEGDGGLMGGGASDSYVTVSWGKFGKPVASTRIIEADQEPNWHEYASILVSVEELNADEKLRLQLWDSDKWTADDDLGRVEVVLHDLMRDERTRNKMCDREDRFTDQNVDQKMPGTLYWSVGYFEKNGITDRQLREQKVNKDVQTKQQLKRQVEEIAERKLREASRLGHTKELKQQAIQDYKELEDDMIISTAPDFDNKSGLLSIQVHNITGLEVQNLQKKEPPDQTEELENEDSEENLPDSYATIILNHKKIYKTRTKPQNAKPFFNAATERFVKDWTTAEIIVSVRDSREAENDALLGVVYLPLNKVFADRHQVIANYPLAGGIGYGRARISLVWRSVQLDLSPNMLGWDYGTLEIKGEIRSKGQLPQELTQHRIKLRTTLSKTRMYPQDGKWQAKSKRNNGCQFLAVRKRYASVLSIEFRTSTIGIKKTPAFGVLWLSELTDEEEQCPTIKVWKGSKEALKRASSSYDYHGMEEGEQPLGEVELDLKFWRGLSGYHHSHAEESQNADVRNVMECLDVINDEKLNECDEDNDDTETDSDSDGESSRRRLKTPDSPQDAKTRRKLRTNTDGSGSEDSDTQSTESSGFAKITAPVSVVKNAASSVIDKIAGDKNTAEDGDRGVRAQLADYKSHRKQLHRKHRGVMQWKSVRTLDWMGGKVKRAKSSVGSLFEHGDKDQGIETEV